jgi:hypothetical protein
VFSLNDSLLAEVQLQQEDVKFISRDPKFEKYFWNSPYTYCGNNPVNRIDPTGMDWEDDDGNKITDHSKIKVYIFYDPRPNGKNGGFPNQSNAMAAAYEKKYGKGTVAMSNVTTMADFKQDWGDMASPDIKEVNLNYHGNNQTLYLNTANSQYITATGNNETNKGTKDVLNVQELPAPSGNISKAQLNVNSCKSNSHTQYPLQGSGLTLMEAFYQTFDFVTVRGTSGGVSYSRFTNAPIPQGGNNWYYSGKIPIRIGNPPTSVYYQGGHK